MFWAFGIRTGAGGAVRALLRVQVCLFPGHVGLVVAVTQCRDSFGGSGCALELTQQQCKCISIVLSRGKQSTVKGFFAWTQDQADSSLPAKGQVGTACLSTFLGAALFCGKYLLKVI